MKKMTPTANSIGIVGAIPLLAGCILPAGAANALNTQILVSGPLVKEPVAVRYSRATSPMGSLKVNGLPSQPLHNFRTDALAFTPEVAHQDPDGPAKNSAANKAMKTRATDALQTRLAAAQPNHH
jgi:hypothetical protein